MGRKRADSSLETFNRESAQEGITYAEAQKRETLAGVGKIRAPHDGSVAYMKASAWDMLKKLESR